MLFLLDIVEKVRYFIPAQKKGPLAGEAFKFAEPVICSVSPAFCLYAPPTLASLPLWKKERGYLSKISCFPTRSNVYPEEVI